jgi:hypothetical protein
MQNVIVWINIDKGSQETYGLSHPHGTNGPLQGSCGNGLRAWKAPRLNQKALGRTSLKMAWKACQ